MVQWARFRAILGLIAGVILILSSVAHSILGWKGLAREMASAQVPPDLIFSLKAGWQFGGLAMLASASSPFHFLRNVFVAMMHLRSLQS